MTRRAALAVGASAVAATRLCAADMPPDQIVALWPDAPPGRLPGQKIVPGTTDRARRMITGIARPQLVVRRPPRPNGAAMLLIPGGGYRQEGIDTGGTIPAAWLAARGITAFMLTYRLPGEGWANRADVMLQDAQRAMRLIRARAGEFGVRPDRIGAMGFSAGGHLAGALATRFDDRVYAAVDAADTASARPDLAVLLFPVISIDPSIGMATFRTTIFGAEPDAATILRHSIDRRVSAATPPVMLVHCADDRVVPVKHSIMMYEAMIAAGRAASLHLFEKGGHGFTTDVSPALPVSAWPDLMLKFAQSQGWPV